MNACKLSALALFVAGAAQAQEADLSASVGLKAWQTRWTTWIYSDTQVINQLPVKDKFVLIPVLGLRYGDFVGSLSGYGSTSFERLDTQTVTRKEFDLNVGYHVMPEMVVSLGYKRLQQIQDTNDYKLSGPTLGLSVTAPLSGALSMYGALGLGRMKSSSNVVFDADYQLTEVGLAYNLGLGQTAKSVSFTAGYRMQVLNSKDASSTAGNSQDARDLTQGFTFGLVVAF